MYNKQVLVDHFNGKRGIDDPEVQREFLLLKQQAEIDWKEMYAGNDTRVTAKSIADDYIYNAQLTAKTQRTLNKIKLIVVIAGLAVAALVYALNR